MAVVFISPKQRQKTFFLGIAIILLLFLLSVAFGVLFSGPKQVPPELVFNKPKVNIDTEIFDSEQFKNLQPFTQIPLQFKYKAATSQGKPAEGLISATSIEEARKTLEEMNFVAIELKEVDIGRENPFTPY